MYIKADKKGCNENKERVKKEHLMIIYYRNTFKKKNVGM